MASRENNTSPAARQTTFNTPLYLLKFQNTQFRYAGKKQKPAAERQLATCGIKKAKPLKRSARMPQY